MASVPYLDRGKGGRIVEKCVEPQATSRKLCVEGFKRGACGLRLAV